MSFRSLFLSNLTLSVYSTSHIGDLHKDKENGNFCPNNLTADEWDEVCNQSVEQGFACEYICQNVRAGEYARLLVKDGQSCAAGGGATFDGDMGTIAQCYPSTDDPTAPGGKTWHDGDRRRFLRMLQPSAKGTCSGMAMGEECVWSVKVPDNCDVSDQNPPGPYCSWSGCDGVMVGGFCDGTQDNCEQS